MTRNIEDTLKNTDLPDFDPGTHRQTLRRHLIDEMGKRSHMAARRKRILTIAVITIVSLSALAGAGVVLQQVIFVGKEHGAYIFQVRPVTPTITNRKVNEDGSIAATATRTYTQYTISPDENGTLDVEQKRQDLEEIEYLRKQDNRKILWIIDTEYQGAAHRSIRYLYKLSDGRVIKMNESVPLPNTNTKQMRSLDFKEIKDRYQAKEGELLPPREEIIDGRTFVFERRKITLSDGKEVIRSVGAPRVEETSEDLDRDGFTLHPNAPNPFNPQTTLRYELPEASEVRIAVYSLTGQEVRTLVDRQMTAGSHQVVWDGRDAQGRDVASGAYLIRMQAAQFLQTQKVSLIR